MRWNNFTYLVKQGVVSVWHNRMMSFASFCIMMVSLLLVGLSLLVIMDVGVVIGNIEDRNEVLVYVNTDATQSEISHITDVLTSNQYAAEVVFYSKEDAWVDQQAKMEDYAKLFEYLDENPMPNTFKVRINDLTKISTAKTQFESIDGVIRVNAPMDFASFLINIRTTLSIIGGTVLVALVTVCLVIVYNAIRSSVFTRRKEISIMKYVGATNTFIRFPFFIEGMFIGVLSGLAAWGLTKLAYESIISFFSEDVTLWQVLGMVNIIPFDEVNWYVLAFDCIAGAFLGALGTIFSMGKHLRV